MPATQNNNGSPLYLDIETIPDYERMGSFGLDPLPDEVAETPLDDCPVPAQFLLDNKSIDAVKRSLRELMPVDTWLDWLSETENAGKNRAGVQAAIETCKKSKAARADAEASRCKLMGTTPEFCKIVAIGWAIGNQKPKCMTFGTFFETEMLVEFWELVDQHSPIITYNGNAFDLPVLMVRSAMLGIPATRLIDLSPYKSDTLDLMQRRFPRGANAMGLKRLAACYDIEPPAGDCDGSQVADLVEAGEYERIAEYVTSDVCVTRELHRFYSGYFCI